MDFLESLNEAQQQAVTAPLKPILVLAGPGTGKTRTLVGRILYVIQNKHIAPHKILAVTFTNKAKEEMRHRLRDKLGDAASDLNIGTFHRFCMTVLREHHDKAELSKQFSIADETTQLLILSRVSRIRDEKSLSTVLNAISSYRLNKENLNPNFQRIAAKWIRSYQQELRKNNVIDFDQILLLTQDLFSRHPELVDTYQQTFDAILVDEFQDTDPIQYAIMKSLAWQHQNVFVVADDDQSIFAWRGAHIENIDRYTRDFGCQEEQVIVLKKNYRSTQCIIDVATRLINFGPRFKEKQINAAIPDSEILKPEDIFLSFPDDDAEIQFIIEQIMILTQKDKIPLNPPLRKGDFQDSSPLRKGDINKFPPLIKGGQRGFSPLRYSDIAILYPTHAIGEQLEAKLLAKRIPCQLIKRQGVFDQEDVRKIILLLKLLHNPLDDVALEQFFQLELNNNLVFQQIRSLKTKNQTFKRTLQQLLSQKQDIAGISRGELRKIITSIFGGISNTISYLEQNPNLELSELINTLCNLTAPVHISTIHSNVHQLRDPLDISGIKDAFATIRATASHGNTVYICGKDPWITDICRCLLSKMGSTLQVASISTKKMGTTFQVASISNADVFLCLDEVSAKRLHASYPNIPDAQIILITPDSPPPNLPHQGGGTSDSPPLAGGFRGGGATTIQSPFSAVVTIFKLIQALTSATAPRVFRNYTVVDLETTSSDTRTAGIVEIGAVKVRDGKIVGEFSRLANPEKPITQGAYNVHHISDEAVQDEKTFPQLLPEFVTFIGDDVLVAHNGFDFDFPILMRLYKKATGGLLPNRRFDTLPLARRLFPGQSVSVDALMQRFGIQDTGERHRALDDTIYLAQIFECLQDVEHSINRRSEHEGLLELIALGIFLAPSPQHPAPGPQPPASSIQHPASRNEEQLFFQLGAKKLLSRFSELPEQFQEVYLQHQIEIESLFEQLSAEESREDTETDQLTHVFSGRDAAISRLKDLTSSFSADNIRDAIEHFLDHAALYNTQDDIREVNAVNLLTIHSAKGLEFPVVFVSGVEKGNLPSFYSVREEGELGQKKLNEQRRLFYVAITRAKQKLFVTYVDKRGEYPKKRSQFLIELGVESEEDIGECEE